MRIALLVASGRHAATRGQTRLVHACRSLADELGQRAEVELVVVEAVDDADPMSPMRAGALTADGNARLSRLFQRARDFDLIHDLSGGSSLLLSPLVSTPVLATIWKNHWDSAGSLLEEEDQRVFYHAASQADCKPGLHFSGVMPVGIDVAHIAFEAEAGAELAYAGDLGAGGGLLAALEVAELGSRAMTIVGAVADQEFFSRAVAPKVESGAVRHIADASSAEADVAIGRAAALVHVGGDGGVQRMALLDALARGTPAICIGAKLAPSIVRDGHTGFRCGTAEEAHAALAKLPSIDRRECRAAVEKQAAAVACADAFIQLYARIIAQTSREDRRPWGYYVVLADEPDHKVKRIVLYPGRRLSLQRHRLRQEHWFLLDGEAVVTLDDDELRVMPGQSVEIPKGCLHRIRNPGSQNLSFIEVQTGDYFGEDDIERLEDDFGRR